MNLVLSSQNHWPPPPKVITSLVDDPQLPEGNFHCRSSIHIDRIWLDLHPEDWEISVVDDHWEQTRKEDVVCFRRPEFPVQFPV